MKLQLFINQSEKEKVYKILAYVDTFDGYLRMPTNISNPIIDVEIENYNELSVELDVAYYDNEFIDISYIDDGNEYDVDAYSEKTKIFNVNYVYIEEFNRYYFIKSMDVINNKLFRLYLDEDELYSLKDKFMKLDALIERNEFLFNPLIEDNQASYLYNKDVKIINVPTTGCVELNTEINSNPNTAYQAYNIIWATMTNGSDIDNDSDGIDMDVSTTQQGFAKGENISALQSHLDLEQLVKVYTKNDVKLSYLKHLTIYPFQSNFLGDTSHGVIKINNVEYTEIMNWKDVEIVTEKVRIGYYDFTSQPFTKYTDYAPYTKYEMYIPYYGYVELNAEDINGSFLEIYYLVNYFTGEATANITAYKDYKTRLLFSSACQLGTRIPLNSTNAYEISKEKDALVISTSLGVVSNVMQIAMGWATYNPTLMVSGSLGLTNTIGGAIAKANQFYVSGKIDMAKAEFNNFNPLKPHLKKTTLTKNNNNAEFEKYMGKPLNEVHNLSTLNGYTKISDIHLENIDALEDEKDNLKTLLINGIII